MKTTLYETKNRGDRQDYKGKAIAIALTIVIALGVLSTLPSALYNF